MKNKYCIVIPHFNHTRQLAPVLEELDRCAIPTILVDDGSDAQSLASLRSIAGARAWVHLDCRARNEGKGAAVQHALRIAASQGYSHAIQIDADGQHELADLGRLCADADAYPSAIVSGMPVFGADIPASRLHGRKLTTFCAAVATLSGDLRDAMCGFRVYPVGPVLKLCAAAHIRPRMQFDTEILVRWHWRGGAVRYVRTPVRYPPGGLSHFRMFRDNVDITLMHTRLILGMLARLPLLLGRRLRRPDSARALDR